MRAEDEWFKIWEPNFLASLLASQERREFVRLSIRENDRVVLSVGPSFMCPYPSRTIKEFFEPNLYIYDAYPGGIGFSEPLYRACDTLLKRTLELISVCPCENGCPSCVGPAADRNERTKEVALEILGRIRGDAQFIASTTVESA